MSPSTSTSYDPRTGAPTAGPSDSTPAEVDDAVHAASQAAAEVATTAPAERAAWLRAVADALEARSDELAQLADSETALGMPRLTGELAKAAAALRYYGDVAAEGTWLGVTVDHATDTAPDVRRLNQPFGPVAVFGASNFPFGFGVLGHDTATALAAGCPVVVKCHPAHPRLSAALARLAADALTEAGAPRGTFRAVAGFTAGERLVTHPQIRAVAFTGSQHGGLALWRLANERPEPIPVYAEMGTVNTVVATRAAVADDATQVAEGFVSSFTLGMGQFCTKPGLLLAPSGSGTVEAVATALTSASPTGWLLTQGIAAAYSAGMDELVAAGARPVAAAPRADAGWTVSPTVLTTDVASLRGNPRLLAECFGPVALVVEYADDTELDAALEALPASLATAVQSGGADDPQVAPLVSRLAGKAGRVAVDAWPTGVAVTWAQHHGGPWPATSAPQATSVGAAALSRFVRPVAYQSVPDTALPVALREDNPWGLPRRVNGVLAS